MYPAPDKSETIGDGGHKFAANEKKHKIAGTAILCFFHTSSSQQGE